MAGFRGSRLKIPKPNEHGVYVAGIADWKVPLKGSHKPKLVIHLVQLGHTRWRYGLATGVTNSNWGHGYGYLPRSGTDVAEYATRDDAVLAGCDEALRHWRDNLRRLIREPPAKKCHESIIGQIEAYRERIADAINQAGESKEDAMATITKRRKVSVGQLNGAASLPEGAKGYAAKHGDNGYSASVSKSIERQAAQSFARECDQVQACRVCGCTENDACDGGCSWIEDDLCSECEDARSLFVGDRQLAIADFVAGCSSEDRKLLNELARPPYRALVREEVLEWDMGQQLIANGTIFYRVRAAGLALRTHDDRKEMVPWRAIAAISGGEGSATPDAIAKNDPDSWKHRTSNIERPTSNGQIEGDPAAWRDLAPGTGAEVGQETAVPKTVLAATEKDVPIDLIDPSPFQPRTVFDESALDQLGDTIVAEGQRDAILLRARPDGRLELVDGERRLRACQRKGLASIRAIVRELTDQQVMAQIMVGFTQRRDLNAIEEARAFQKSLEVLGGTQQELAGRLGVTQAHVSNRLRLLDAPERWQQRVISREMPHTFLRDVLTCLKSPPLEKSLDEGWRGLVKDAASEGREPTKEEWEHEALWRVRQVTEPLSANVYDGTSGRHLNVSIEPSGADQERLGLVEVPVDRFDGDQVTELRATNTKLHKKLWDQALGVARKAAAAAAEKKEKGGAKKTVAKERQLTPAELRAKKAERERQFQTKLDAWRTDWLRMLIAPRLNFSQDAKTSAKLMMWLATNGEGYRSDRGEVLDQVLHAGKGSGSKAAWSKLRDCSDAPQVHHWALAFLVGLFWDHVKHEARPEIPASIVEDVAAELEIDLAQCWSGIVDGYQTCAGPLTRGLYELHDREDLEKLAGELKVNIFGKDTKTKIVDTLVGAPQAGKRLSLPKCVKPLKGNTKGRKAKGRKKR